MELTNKHTVECQPKSLPNLFCKSQYVDTSHTDWIVVQQVIATGIHLVYHEDLKVSLDGLYVFGGRRLAMAAAA